MKFFRKIRTGLATVAIVTIGANAALADFPERTIEIIHPWGPGKAMAVSQLLSLIHI